MRKLMIGAGTILLMGIGALLFFNRNSSETSSPEMKSSEITLAPPISFWAYFEIYTNGTKRDFSDSKYHNRSDDVYIESTDPARLTVRKDDITWQEFFDTLPAPFKISQNCLYTGTGQKFCSNASQRLTFTLNDKEAPNSLSTPIRAGDKLQIRYN